MEGKFVALLGNSRDAICLVNLGIGKRCFVVAMVNLAGDDIDYELISLSPLSLLSFSCHNQSRRLKVCSVFKATQVYQMCTCRDQAQIWNRFTSHIRHLCVDRSDNIWIDQKLSCPTIITTDTRQYSELDDDYSTILNELYPYQAQMSRRLQAHYRHRREDRRPSMDRCGSLPTILPSLNVTDAAFKQPFRSRSEQFMDIKFDSFVNTAPTRYSGFGGKIVACSWDGSSDDFFRLETVSLDTNNHSTAQSGNEDEGDEEEGEPEAEEAWDEPETGGAKQPEEEKKPSLLKKLARFLPCLKCLGK